MSWAHIPDLGWVRRPKLHGMQGVRGSNPLSSTPQHRRSAALRGHHLISRSANVVSLGPQRGRRRSSATASHSSTAARTRACISAVRWR